MPKKIPKCVNLYAVGADINLTSKHLLAMFTLKI